jgi:hypothetical protein
MITDKNPVATEKLRTNVSEFIIYMYQMEDLIRIYNFNLEDIKQYVIHHFPVQDSEKKQMEDWFRDLMQRMKKQEVTERGHLAEVQVYVDELLRIKEHLLPTDPEFAAIYNAARPHIRESIMESHGMVKNDVQACLNGIYGLLLCRMNDKEVPEEIEKSLHCFGDVLSYLSYHYRKESFTNNN